MDNFVLYLVKNDDGDILQAMLIHTVKGDKIEEIHGKKAVEEASRLHEEGKEVFVSVRNTSEFYSMEKTVFDDNTLKDVEILCESKFEQPNKFLIIMNFDRDVAILFEKKFNEKNELHLKKKMKDKVDVVLDEAYLIASEIDNQMNYQIVVEEEEGPVVFESGFITPDGDLIPKRSEEEDSINDENKDEKLNINESIENDEKFDWYLEYRNKDDIILFADENEDFIETDRHPKHREIEGNNALIRARKLLKDGLKGGIGVSKGNGSRKTEGFLRLGEDGKTLMIEIESKGSRNGTLIPLI